MKTWTKGVVLVALLGVLAGLGYTRLKAAEAEARDERLRVAKAAWRPAPCGDPLVWRGAKRAFEAEIATSLNRYFLEANARLKPLRPLPGRGRCVAFVEIGQVVVAQMHFEQRAVPAEAGVVTQVEVLLRDPAPAFWTRSSFDDTPVPLDH